MITKDLLTKWRHKLIRAQELYTQADKETFEVIREMLKTEESYGNQFLQMDNDTNVDTNKLITNTIDNFRPTTKKVGKGDPLAELLHSIPQEQRASLIDKLQKKKENSQ